MSLYTAESRRLLKRRFTRFLVIGALVGLALIAGGVFLTNHRVGPAQVAEAQAHADRDYQEAVRYAAAERKRCETAPAGQDCSQITPPTPDQFEAQWYLPSTFDFRENFGNMVTALAAILALIGFVIGASYVGAEWSSGGMMNLLLWRPQRLRVLGTKLGALLVSIGALTVAVAVAWTGFFWLTAKLRGTTQGVTSGVWQSYALMELRGLALVLAATALGFALASLGRHTAMALGAAVGVVVLFQFGLGAVLATAQVKFYEAYLVPVWVQAWLAKEYEISDYSSCDFSSNNGQCEPDTFTLAWPLAGSVLGGVVLLVVVAALWTMRSRDVT